MCKNQGNIPTSLSYEIRQCISHILSYLFHRNANLRAKRRVKRSMKSLLTCPGIHQKAVLFLFSSCQRTNRIPVFTCYLLSAGDLVVCNSCVFRFRLFLTKQLLTSASMAHLLTKAERPKVLSIRGCKPAYLGHRKKCQENHGQKRPGSKTEETGKPSEDVSTTS